MSWVLAALVTALVLPRPAPAHEVRPGYLELRQTGLETFSILWKVPARGDERFSIQPVFSESCTASFESAAPTADAWVEQGRVACPRGLGGQTVAIDGLAATLTDVLVRVMHANGFVQVARLTPAAPSFVVAAPAARLDTPATYLGLGVERVVLGIDPLLLALALVLLVGPTPRLVATVAAFTLAHSLTLAAATLGWVRVPSQPLTATIALGTVFVAAQVVHGLDGRPGLVTERPWVPAFLLGLLHGFCFAAALAEAGPSARAAGPLLFFNLGVELGLVALVAGALTALAAARGARRRWPAWPRRVSAYAIGTVAAYLTIARVLGFGQS